MFICCFKALNRLGITAVDCCLYGAFMCNVKMWFDWSAFLDSHFWRWFWCVRALWHWTLLWFPLWFISKPIILSYKVSNISASQLNNYIYQTLHCKYQHHFSLPPPISPFFIWASVEMLYVWKQKPFPLIFVETTCSIAQELCLITIKKYTCMFTLNDICCFFFYI